MRHQTLDGAESRTRTCNLLITGQLLYQLSYSSECDIILPQIRNMSRDKIGNDMEIKASVREIAELLFGSGDLAGEEYLRRRAEEGILIHKEHQSRYLAGDEKEVHVSYQEEGEDYRLFISGRIDGVLKRGKKTIIEEIKSTTRDLNIIDEETVPAHLAQAKLYAFIYFRNTKKRKIDIRLTYIQVQIKEIKRIDLVYSRSELEDFFRKTIGLYLEWLRKIAVHEETRNKSIAGLAFPFPEYREGQRELMGACYRTLMNKGILYAIAPTGIGKTAAVLYSSLKTIHQAGQKLFYLTAKNLGKKIVLETVGLLMEKGLQAKTVEITAKDRICFLEERDCDPEKCPYAENYYSKLFPALQDIFLNENLYDRETITAYAKKHRLCPFEFSLDISNYSDIIVCDYNYAFCPRTHLTRFFDEGSPYIPLLLVDEAHNLVSRSQDMYSGEITKGAVLSLRKLLRENGIKLKQFQEVLNYFEEYEKETNPGDFFVRELNEEFVGAVERLVSLAERKLGEKKDVKNKAEIVRILLDFSRFYKMSDFFDEDYVYTVGRTEKNLRIAVNCLDASKFLLRTIKERTAGAVFFSATLYPIRYYQQLLTQGEDLCIRIDSPFKQENLKLLAVDSVSTRYRDRKQTVSNIINIIRVLGRSKAGNYIVFFPSYEYLNLVHEELKNDSEFDFIVQKQDFTQDEREQVIGLFQNSEKTQIGLFVMGGMFSEGIDYIGDMLSGVIVVGTGLPAFGGFNNVVRDHFERKFSRGFDFAYTYPGFAKVVQAVGRVIRNESDRGVAILVDDRFASRKYLGLYPKEWSHIRFVSEPEELKKELEDFWK